LYNCDCWRCADAPPKKEERRVYIKLKDKPELRKVPGCVDFSIGDGGNVYFNDIHGRVIMVLAIESVEELKQEVL
jgi:hypothetical protein